MSRFVWDQLARKRRRSLALAAAIFVAAASFSLLSAAGKSSAVRVRGSVESNFRTAYDILVRPRGSALPLERERGLVRDNYLSGLFGGIRLEQYAKIKELPGVDVAAPVANIGYVIPTGGRPVPLNNLLSRSPAQLYRVVSTTVAQRGMSRYPSHRTEYIYYTRRNPFYRVDALGAGFGEAVPGRSEPVAVCPPSELPPGPATQPFSTAHIAITCYSAKSPGVGNDYFDPGKVQATAGLAFPILLAAIDPEQEARLLHLDRAIVRGRYLREGDGPRVVNVVGGTYARTVPIIASTKTFVDEQVVLRIERLRTPTGRSLPLSLASGTPRLLRFLRGLHGTVVGTYTVPASTMYADALGGEGFQPNSNLSYSYWTSSPVGYQQQAPSGPLRPRVVTNPLSVWRSSPTPTASSSYTFVPMANADRQFRRLHARIGSPYTPVVNGHEVLDTPSMRFVGRYDASRLPGFSPLSRVPLETYYPPVLQPGDARARRLLHRKPLLPTENIADYVAQPPLLLTTLNGMRAFLNRRFYAGANAEAPISVVRVRVRGVSGPDAVSRARIRQVATEIHDATGLQVDITAGSSPRELEVDLPAGKFGRPQLLLREGWSKKGVSLAFLQALDKKRLGLLALILVTCVGFLANGAFAVVRERRREIGTLACVGWSTRAIYVVVFSELVVIAAVAGLAAAIVSIGVARIFGLDLPIWQALLVAPLAVALAAVAGGVPAWRAARTVPLDAVRAPVVAPRRGRRVRGTVSLALTNVARTPARSIVAVAGLFVSSAALTVLISINRAFRGDVVGTVLGNAISVQVRGLDFVAVGLIIALSAFSLVDVLYLNIRERAAELVTLWTVGWTDRQLGRLIATEAALVGFLGSAAGAILGLVVSVELGVSWSLAVATGAIAATGCTLVALAASTGPAARIAAIATPAVLSDE